MIERLGRGLSRFLSSFLIASVHVYQAALRPLFPSACRYQPSCSEYFILAVRKYGPLRGACKGFLRICRCNPFYPGGFDPP